MIFKYIYRLNIIFIFPYLPICFHLPYIPSERSSDFRNLVCFRSSSKTFRNSSLCVLAFRNRADTLCSQGSWMVSTWGFYGDVMGIYPNISKNNGDVMQIHCTMIFSHEKMMKNMGFNDEKPSMMTQLGLNQPLLVGKTHYLEASSY